VDVGGVLIDRVHDRTDTSFFGARYLETPEVSGAFAALAHLARLVNGRVYLVSKCGPSTEQRTREWLAHRRFTDVTGIPEDHALFCRERRDKAPICSQLGVTHFVDDRLEVLGYLVEVPYRLLFDPSPVEVEAHRRHLPGVQVVHSWRDAARFIEETLGRR
jgi:hypothetical protein